MATIRDASVGSAAGLAGIQERASVAALAHIFRAGSYVDFGYWATWIGSALRDWALGHIRILGTTRCHVWVLEENTAARRFYERRRWRENGRTRAVPYPPHPLDVGYTRELG
jgi:GNAT superfamily N-acetyltransferase